MFRSRISLRSKLEDSSIYPLSFSETETIDVHRDRTIQRLLKLISVATRSKSLITNRTRYLECPWYGVILINRAPFNFAQIFPRVYTDIQSDVIIVDIGKIEFLRGSSGPKIPEISAIHHRFRCHAVPRCN